MSTTCPVCRQVGKALLQPDQPCAQCRSQEAWAELGARGLRIDSSQIEEAARRRAGEAAGEPLWKRALPWLAPALSIALAAFAVWSIVELLSARPLGPLRALLDELHATARRTTLAGLGALVLGIVLLARLRRRRHHRRIAFILGHSAAVVAGASALVLGGLQWSFGSGGFGGQYTTMPARESMPVSASVQRILDATVVVLATDASGDARSAALGTGAIIAADAQRAWIVTCSHVAMPYAAVGAYRRAKDARPVWIQLSDGREGRATVRWTAPPPLDIAVVELPIENPPAPVQISADPDPLAEGSAVLFVPNPYRNGWLVHHGELVRREPHDTPAGTYDLLYTDLPVVPGDSGSGLFDARGQLVGLNTWTRTGAGGAAEGISLPSEAMRELVRAIERNELDRLDDARPPRVEKE